MRKRNLILGVISIVTLCLTGCGKPSTSFEEVVDSITYSEIVEMMNKAEIYEQNFNIFSNFSMSEDNVVASMWLSTNSKENKKDSEWETKISLKVNASWDGEDWRETIKINWNAIIKHLTNAVYFKLSSFNITGPEDFTSDEFLSGVESIKNKWFSFELTEEMINKIKAGLPEDFELNGIQRKENLEKLEQNLKKYEDNLKKAIKNEGFLVYSGIYSEFNWYNAYKFSIDKKKVFNATTEYIKTFVPEEDMDDYMREIEQINIDEVLKDFPLKNFEWYFVIIWEKRVQTVIENLEINDTYSKIKLNGTFGNDRYELSINEDGENVLLFSAKMNKAHYDVILKVDDLEILKWTVTPKIFFWKITVDFDLSINIDEEIKIPLKWSWNWQEISKFKVEKPTNSQNLLEDIMKDVDFENLDPSAYQLITEWMDNKQTIGAPVVAGWVLVASLLPRMQSAQWRARDVARKTALSQLQSAIVTWQWDKWNWPGLDKGATKWLPISKIEKEIKEAWMHSVPTDPIEYNANYWLWENYAKNIAEWEYLYLVTKRNWVQNGWFILMANTEVEWSSNWVVCKNKSWLENWYITNNTDMKNINLCQRLTKWESCSAKNCTYTNDDELRYMLMY